MNRSELERLCRPRLDTLWEDIRIHGLPLWSSLYGDRSVIGGAAATFGPKFGWNGIEKWHLDLLAGPIGADVLSRRVATHLAPKAKVTSSVRWTWSGPKWLGWYLGTEDLGGFSFFGENGGLLHVRDYIQVDTLDKLDPTCDERVDWGPLGSARLVDLAALALVGQHLTRSAP